MCMNYLTQGIYAITLYILYTYTYIHVYNIMCVYICMYIFWGWACRCVWTEGERY